MKEFKDRLRETLKLVGIKQAELARQAGLAESQVSSYVNGKYRPNGEALAKIAKVLGVSPSWLAGEIDLPVAEAVRAYQEPMVAKSIPIVGRVSAGIPVLADENMVGTVMVKDFRRDLFGLRVKGDSMSPRIMDGDLVIVLKQDTADDGDVVIALVEDEATCKVFRKTAWGATLVPFNASYAPLVFSGEECQRLHIVGKVIESRHSWE